MSLLSTLAFADATGGGNGGDAIVCDNGKDIILLDMYEAEDRGFEINLEGRTIRENINLVIDRFKKVDKRNAKFVANIALDIVADLEQQNDVNMKKVRFVNSILREIDDSLEVTLPRGCHLEQIAVNRDVYFEEDKQFSFRLDLWEKLSLKNKSMLVMHEAIYEWLRRSNIKIKDSRFARYLNGYLSQKLETINLIKYIKILKRAKSHDINIKFTLNNIDCLYYGCSINLSSFNEVKEGLIYTNYFGRDHFFYERIKINKIFGRYRVNNILIQKDNKVFIEATFISDLTRISKKKRKMIIGNNIIKFASTDFYWKPLSSVVYKSENGVLKSLFGANTIKYVILNGIKYKNIKEVLFDNMGNISKVIY
jgi:hypothetical protein